MSVTATRVPMIVSSRRTAMLVCGYALLAAIVCAAMAAAAVLFKAPAGVVPLIALSCVVLPILASWRLSDAVTVLRFSPRRMDRAAVANLRRVLAELPEIEHPHGF
jgi:hypothetical protein